MMADKNIRFIRKNGRIIPIRTGEHNLAKGAALVGGGLGAAAVAGAVAADLTRSAARSENAARKTAKAARFALKHAQNLGPLFEGPAKKTYITAGHEALKSMVGARQTLFAATRAKNIGFGIGSALVGAGVHRLLKETDLKDNKKTRATIATGAGIATHFTIRSSYFKSIGAKTLKFSDALKLAAKAVIKKGL